MTKVSFLLEYNYCFERIAGMKRNILKALVLFIIILTLAIVSGNVYARCVNFKVTAVPESVLTILFLTGGTILAVRRLRRK